MKTLTSSEIDRLERIVRYPRNSTAAGCWVDKQYITTILDNVKAMRKVLREMLHWRVTRGTMPLDTWNLRKETYREAAKLCGIYPLEDNDDVWQGAKKSKSRSLKDENTFALINELVLRYRSGMIG